MPIFSRLRRSPPLLHLLGWVGFALYEQLVVLLTAAQPLDLLNILVLYCLNAVVFYANCLLLLPRLYAQRRYGRYVAAVLVLLLAYAFARIELTQYWHVPNSAQSLGYVQIGILALYRGSFFLFCSMGYWCARNAIQLAVQKRQQEYRLRAAERSLFESNLAFLKSQINPHFLFNSLNFLYAQVYPHSESAAQAILLLADTMRYALQESREGKVPLTQEVQHLANFITLQQLRFNNQLQIDFKVDGSVHFLLIIPLVLITFVENCFKHGELADPADPLRIHLQVVQSQLTFYTRNRKRIGPKEKSYGIGLVNIRQRLLLLYPGRHTLHLTDELLHYSCTLVIDL